MRPWHGVNLQLQVHFFSAASHCLALCHTNGKVCELENFFFRCDSTGKASSSAPSISHKGLPRLPRLRDSTHVEVQHFGLSTWLAYIFLANKLPKIWNPPMPPSISQQWFLASFAMFTTSRGSRFQKGWVSSQSLAKWVALKNILGFVQSFVVVLVTPSTPLLQRSSGLPCARDIKHKSKETWSAKLLSKSHCCGCAGSSPRTANMGVTPWTPVF